MTSSVITIGAGGRQRPAPRAAEGESHPGRDDHAHRREREERGDHDEGDADARPPVAGGAVAAAIDRIAELVDRLAHVAEALDPAAEVVDAAQLVERPLRCRRSRQARWSTRRRASRSPG